MAEKNREVSRARRGAGLPEKKERVEKQATKRFGHYMTKMLAESSGRVPMIKHCNRCGGGILEGVYYYCTVCPDYNLCEDCERDNDELYNAEKPTFHDALHTTIKYRV